MQPIDMLVRQLLLARIDGMSAQQVAAFLSGWSSALELVARSDLTLPDAPPAVHEALAAVLAAIEAAQREVLRDPDEPWGPA